eukprot:3645471-Alexandrium_andersonii.AAC.1
MNTIVKHGTHALSHSLGVGIAWGGWVTQPSSTKWHFGKRPGGNHSAALTLQFALEDIPKDSLSTQTAGLRVASHPLPEATSSGTKLMNAPQAQWEAWRFQWRCVQRVCVLACSCSLRTRVCRYALACVLLLFASPLTPLTSR